MSNRSFDALRMGRVAGFGFVVVGLLGYFWYRLLLEWFPFDTFTYVVIRVVVDQVSGSAVPCDS